MVQLQSQFLESPNYCFSSVFSKNVRKPCEREGKVAPLPAKMDLCVGLAGFAGCGAMCGGVGCLS